MDDHYVVRPHGRFFALFEIGEHLLIEETMNGPPEDKLICVAVYRKGAEEVKRRLEGQVQVRRTKVICRKCRATLRSKGIYEVPEDVDLAADAPLDRIPTDQPLDVLFPEEP